MLHFTCSAHRLLVFPFTGFTAELDAVHAVQDTDTNRGQPKWGRPARHDAPELDWLAHSVTVTYAQRLFIGRTFSLLRPISGRGNARLLIRLPDSKIRAIPRLAMDLEAALPPASVPAEVA